jgi:hypothetical protein
MIKPVYQGQNLTIWRNRIEFCEKHLPSFRKMDNTDDNHPGYRIEMFTILTQHIYGRSVTELIDMGIKIEQMHRARLAQQGIDLLTVEIAENSTRTAVQSLVLYE